MYSKDESPTNGCEGRLLDNFRPVKPLHGRVVKASFQWSLTLYIKYLLLDNRVIYKDMFKTVFWHNNYVFLCACNGAIVTYIVHDIYILTYISSLGWCDSARVHWNPLWCNRHFLFLHVVYPILQSFIVWVHILISVNITFCCGWYDLGKKSIIL